MLRFRKSEQNYMVAELRAKRFIQNTHQDNTKNRTNFNLDNGCIC